MLTEMLLKREMVPNVKYIDTISVWVASYGCFGFCKWFLYRWMRCFQRSACVDTFFVSVLFVLINLVYSYN